MTSFKDHTIADILRSRNATLNSKPGDSALATERYKLTRLIEEQYPTFEPIRDHLLNQTPKNRQIWELCTHGEKIIHHLNNHGLITVQEDKTVAAHAEARRYLSGGWLEELAWHAAMEAGADEAVFSQTVNWSAKGYHGKNEIDLIVRRRDRLGFISCKAVNSEFNSDNRKQRNRLMDALHEADNLVDHFGGENDRVAVLVTADLIDELKEQPRYMALMGKAAVLDVRIIPLEELGWPKLVAAVSELIEEDN